MNGKKIDIIRKNNLVCFEFDINTEIIKAENACKWGMRYQSVIGFGKAFILENFDEKQKALEIIMRQHSDQKFIFSDLSIQNTAIIKVEIESMTGKQSG